MFRILWKKCDHINRDINFPEWRVHISLRLLFPWLLTKSSNLFKATFPTSSGHSVLGIFCFSFHLNNFCFRRDILVESFTNLKRWPNHTEKIDVNTKIVTRHDIEAIFWRECGCSLPASLSSDTFSLLFSRCLFVFVFLLSSVDKPEHFPIYFSF